MNDIRFNPICTAIDSEDAKCHPDLGDGRKSYKNNDYYVFKRNEQWYVVLERQHYYTKIVDGEEVKVPSGNFVTELTMDRMKTLVDIFGWDNLIEYNGLPQETIEGI